MDYHAMPNHRDDTFQRTEDRRKEFAKRRHRESTKRRLKELQTERPVLDTVFRNSSSASASSKFRNAAHNLRNRSRELSMTNITVGEGGTDGTTTTNSDGHPLMQEQHQQQQQPHHEPRKHGHHSFLYTMLSPHSKRWQAIFFKHFITAVILMDLILFILSTDEAFTYLSDRFYHAAEGIASTIFLFEYLGRVYTITEKKKYRELGPITGRLAYMRTFSAIIDLVAAIPFFLEIPTGWHLPTLTYLRFIRLFRILKTEDYMRAFDAVYRVVYYNRQILYVACLVCISLVLVTSILLYYCRPQGDKVNPLFESLGDTMYMSTLMLTGGGGPDTEDLPWYTKAVVLLTSVFSVAMFAIFASMLTWGFEAEAERMAKQARKRVLKRREMEKSGSFNESYFSSSSEEESDGNTTDEEYFKIIGT